MTIRILHIIDRLDCYGTSRQLSLLVRDLPPDRCSNRICALTVARTLPHDLAPFGANVVAIAERGSALSAGHHRLRRLLASYKPHVIHGWGGRANLVASLAKLFRRNSSLVVAQRTPPEQCDAVGRLLQRAIFRSAGVIIVNLASTEKQCQVQGLAPGKLVLIRNAVVPPKVSLSRRQLLSELGLPSDCRLVCTVTSFRSQAGTKDAIWAADLLKVIRKDVHLLIAGDGPRREQIVLFRDQVRIQDKVHFLGCRPDLPEIVAHCDVFWATDHLLAQPNAILEAMALGVPVVATATAGNAELIQHEGTGFLITPGDRAALARYTNQLLDNPTLAHRVSAAARQHALTHFRAADMITRHMQLYEQLV